MCSGFNARFYFCAEGGVIISKDWKINDEIRAKEVRLVGDDGEQMGIVPTSEALSIAEERELDLVEVAPSAKPPVCRFMDYGKFKFEQGKREKEAKKKQKVISIKEVKMRPNIEDHDFDVKSKNARKFLSAGDKLKFTVMFRGREITHPELGMRLAEKFAEELSDISVIEKPAKVEGRNMTMILVPKKEHETQAKKSNEEE